MRENVIIRQEWAEDEATVENLVREAFWNVYRPGCLERYVLHRLRASPNFVRELSFVMEVDGQIVGQNVFVRTAIQLDGGGALPVLTMGPICIRHDLRRKGYGKRLLDHSLAQASAQGFGSVCFEDDIGFYGKSGFVVAATKGIRYHGLPDGADASFFLSKELKPGYLDGVHGEYATPQEYFVCEQDPKGFAAYEAQFPAKEKLKLPGQIFEA